jgi:endonuclease YncB( thermonuclease family)
VGPASVIDGDTIEIDGRRIHLHGIDAPDGRQSCKNAAGKSYPCGKRAASALADKIKSRTIRCNPKSTDSSGNKVAVCWLDNVNLNIWIVSQGWAIADRDGAANYMPWEDEARKAKRGLWAGTFTEPSEWQRSQQR